MDKKIYKLENWCLLQDDGRIGLFFGGEVYNHETRKDGQKITTSEITVYDGKYFHTISGSIYELGIVSEDYEKEFPNAIQRVINNCPKLSIDFLN